jgi:hypothetical protein
VISSDRKDLDDRRLKNVYKVIVIIVFFGIWESMSRAEMFNPYWSLHSLMWLEIYGICLRPVILQSI